MTRCAIIGAGLAGLTAAYQLRQELPSAQIDVWEGAERIGGKLHTVPFDGGPVDMGAEAFLARRDDAREFFAELGLADEIVYPSALRPLLYSQETTHALPTAGVMGIPATGQAVAVVWGTTTAGKPNKIPPSCSPVRAEFLRTTPARCCGYRWRRWKNAPMKRLPLPMSPSGARRKN